MVQHGRQMVDLVVGGHDAFRMPLLGAVAVGFQLIVIFDLIADIEIIIAAPPFLVVRVKMLEHRACADAVAALTRLKGRAVIVVLILHALNVRGGHLSRKVRVLAVALLVPSPPGIPAEVDGRPEAAVASLAYGVPECAGFFSRHVARPADELPVKSRGHADRLREGCRRCRRISLPLSCPRLDAVGSFPRAGGSGDPQPPDLYPEGEACAFFLDGHMGNEPFYPLLIR